ncbi:hypothetical protein COL940_005914, partial [Colletotrichum noveboracense]
MSGRIVEHPRKPSLRIYTSFRKIGRVIQKIPHSVDDIFIFDARENRMERRVFINQVIRGIRHPHISLQVGRFDISRNHWVADDFLDEFGGTLNFNASLL